MQQTWRNNVTGAMVTRDGMHTIDVEMIGPTLIIIKPHDPELKMTAEFALVVRKKLQMKLRSLGARFMLSPTQSTGVVWVDVSASNALRQKGEDVCDMAVQIVNSTMYGQHWPAQSATTRAYS